MCYELAETNARINANNFQICINAIYIMRVVVRTTVTKFTIIEIMIICFRRKHYVYLKIFIILLHMEYNGD